MQLRFRRDMGWPPGGNETWLARTRCRVSDTCTLPPLFGAVKKNAPAGQRDDASGPGNRSWIGCTVSGSRRIPSIARTQASAAGSVVMQGTP